MLKPVEKQRVAEEIAEQLRSLILNGQYPPGAKLPPERELSKRLQVNRASLREALKKLEHLGLVRIRQGDGTRVQNFMETGGIELVQHLLPLAGGQARADPRSPRVPPHPRPRDRAPRRRPLAANDHGGPRAPARPRRSKPTSPRPRRGAVRHRLRVLRRHRGRCPATRSCCSSINTVRDGVRGYLPLLANLAAPDRISRARAPPRADRRHRARRRRRPPAASPTTTCAWARRSAGRLGGRPELVPQPLPELEHAAADAPRRRRDRAARAPAPRAGRGSRRMQVELAAILAHFAALAAVAHRGRAADDARGADGSARCGRIAIEPSLLVERRAARRAAPDPRAAI